jgi:predicted RNase H-like HicB family nuclease
MALSGCSSSVCHHQGKISDPLWAASTRLLTGGNLEHIAVLTHAEERGFVAFNPETATTQGETIEEALANLCEATTLYLTEFPLRAIGHPLATTFTVPEPTDV